MNPSPYLKDLNGMTVLKVMADLMRTHQKFNDGLVKLQEYTKQVHERAKIVEQHMERIQSLPAGPKGDPGVVPHIDLDALKREIVVNLPSLPDPDELIDHVLALVPIPEDGKDAVVDIEILANAVIDKLEKEKKLEPKHIKGYKESLDAFSGQIAGLKYGKDTWARGGGDTVTAGTNVTITTDGNGKKVISATSGSPTALTPTGTINATNQVFGVVSRPSSVISDGITYFENFGYTYSALQITFDVPPSQYVKYYA